MTQLRQANLAIDQVPLNLACRDRIIPFLQALQQVYSKVGLIARILRRVEVEDDVNVENRKDRGRAGMDYWPIVVAASVRLGCDYTYDRHWHVLATIP